MCVQKAAELTNNKKISAALDILQCRRVLTELESPRTIHTEFTGNQCAENFNQQDQSNFFLTKKNYKEQTTLKIS